jgi:hypothetical protein
MGVFLIKITINSKKNDVIAFLEQLQSILLDPNFDIDNNMILISKKKTQEKEIYSTPYTILDLDYETSDIVERLKELTVQEYSETLYDRDDDNPPLLFVFGKDINCKKVYIKLKIKDFKKKVLCLSFHYAEHAMNFPYR